MTPDQLISSVAGAALSLLLAYIPGLNTQFDKLSTDGKRSVMGLLIILAALGSLVYQCGGFQDACLRANWLDAGGNLFMALTANQGAYKLLVEGRRK